MKNIKIYITGIALAFTTTFSFAQNAEQAKALFKQGKYTECKEAFRKLNKRYPRNGSYSYWYGVCLYETGERDASLPFLQYAEERKVRNAYRYVGDWHHENGNFEEAIQHYQRFIEEVDPKDELFAKYVRILNQTEREAKYIKRVEKVIFVDSIVVPKARLFDVYQVSKEIGQLGPCSQLVQTESEDEGTAHRIAMGDKVYYSHTSPDGTLQLYMRYKMLDDWSKPTLLEGFPAGDNNYPFLLSDGMTIYFANNNGEGLGGYDLYVTRYNSNTDRFLVPENMGMPFNSPANDYMMAIDEANNIGWFASDRYQNEDSVCVYTFIPNEEKSYYDYEEGNRRDIYLASRITSIETTQALSPEKVKQARQSLLKMNLSQNGQPNKQHDFTFIIDDFTDYHKLTDFKNPEALKLFKQWQLDEKNLKKMEKQLDEKRYKYAHSSAKERQAMTKEILELEQIFELKQREYEAMERQIRIAENSRTAEQK